MQRALRSSRFYEATDLIANCRNVRGLSAKPSADPHPSLSPHARCGAARRRRRPFSLARSGHLRRRAVAQMTRLAVLCLPTAAIRLSSPRATRRSRKKKMKTLSSSTPRHGFLHHFTPRPPPPAAAPALLSPRPTGPQRTWQLPSSHLATAALDVQTRRPRRAASSCLTLAHRFHHRAVTTIEGLRNSRDGDHAEAARTGGRRHCFPGEAGGGGGDGDQAEAARTGGRRRCFSAEEAAATATTRRR